MGRPRVGTAAGGVSRGWGLPRASGRLALRGCGSVPCPRLRVGSGVLGSRAASWLPGRWGCGESASRGDSYSPHPSVPARTTEGVWRISFAGATVIRHTPRCLRGRPRGCGESASRGDTYSPHPSVPARTTEGVWRISFAGRQFFATPLAVKPGGRAARPAAVRQDGAMPTIAEARDQWSPEGVYLNTASYGLPPRDGFDAVQAGARRLARGRDELGALGREHRGRARGLRGDGRRRPPRASRSARPCRSSSGLAAACLPAGTRVLVPDVEFTSTLFPFLVQEARGVTVTTVEPSRLAEAIDARTDVVAFSAVQMSTRRGRRPRRDRRRRRATTARRRCSTRRRHAAGCRSTRRASTRSSAAPTSG